MAGLVRGVRLIVLLCLMTASPLFAQNKPKISSVSPDPPEAGQTVIVHGQNFGSNPGVLWIGTAPAMVTNWGDTQITATVPNEVSSGSLAVLRKDAPQQWSEPRPFVAKAPPVPDNGIIATGVKVYDNATLQQMLDNAQARLASLQFIDQSQISAHVGAIQGATSQQTGFALNVNGPSIPGVQTTANSGNTSINTSQGVGGQTNGATSTFTYTPSSPSTDQLQVTSPTTTSTNSSSFGSTITGPSTQTVTTQAQQNPVIPSMPTATSYTLPSFSPSASNILNEQVQLNSEAAGLALLLEGSLTDQTFRVIDPSSGDTVTIPQRRITIGIPVSIQPKDKFKGDAAEIIVTLKLDKPLLPPSITAILPEDKTYNVATISSQSFSLGGAVTTGLLSVGGSWFHQKQTYYIVQAQDTVALQRAPNPAKPDEISFGWQIRPVLGNKTVSSGMRTLFVQLALPVLAPKLNLAEVTVETNWKKIDSKTNVIDDTPIASVSLGRNIQVPNFDPAPDIVTVDDPIDNADGTVTVRVTSDSNISGSFVKIGESVISQGSPNAVFDSTHLDFTVSSSVLANNKAFWVSRAGAYSEIISPQVASTAVAGLHCLTLGSTSITPESSTSAVVKATITLGADTGCGLASKNLSDLHPVAMVGSKVFGFRDAPITVDDTNHALSFRVPLDLVRSSPSLTVERMLWGPAFRTTQNISPPLVPTISSATVTQKSKDGMKLALIGSSLRQLAPPTGMNFENDSDTGRILNVPTQSSQGLSQIALKATSGDLLLVAMPADTTTATPALDTHTSIQASKPNTLIVKGSHLDNFIRVEFNKVKIQGAKLAADKKSISVPLSAQMVKAPGIELTFYFADSHPLTYKVDAFDKHNEVVQPQSTTPGQQPEKN